MRWLSLFATLAMAAGESGKVELVAELAFAASVNCRAYGGVLLLLMNFCQNRVASAIHPSALVPMPGPKP